jgi:hypothetical protein
MSTFLTIRKNQKNIKEAFVRSQKADSVKFQRDFRDRIEKFDSVAKIRRREMVENHKVIDAEFRMDQKLELDALVKEHDDELEKFRKAIVKKTESNDELSFSIPCEKKVYNPTIKRKLIEEFLTSGKKVRCSGTDSIINNEVILIDEETNENDNENLPTTSKRILQKRADNYEFQPLMEKNLNIIQQFSQNEINNEDDQDFVKRLFD